MSKVGREVFTVIKYRLNAEQVKKAIEMYLCEEGRYLPPDAKYEVYEGGGAVVTVWYPNDDEHVQHITEDDRRP